jgi:hypothetical protein
LEASDSLEDRRFARLQLQVAFQRPPLPPEP